MSWLPPPRKKRQVREKAGSQLPISTHGTEDKPHWDVYSAIYYKGTITVMNSNEADALWHNGYFGDRGDGGVTDGKKEYLNKKKRRKLMCADDLVEGNMLEVDMEVEEEEYQDKETNDNVGDYGDTKQTTEEEQGDPERQKGNTREHDEGNTSTDSKTKWRTVLALNTRKMLKSAKHPSPPLTLEPAEAFFLSYAMSCLVVYKKDTKEDFKGGRRRNTMPVFDKLNVDDLWTLLTKDEHDFAIKYTVYHHYRTKGWVVKCGLQYGADWILYPVGPPFYHAHYTVTIYPIWEDTLNFINDNHDPLNSLAATERVSTHVNKTPLVCFVQRPRALTDERLRYVDCLRELRLQEVVYSRWNHVES